MPKKKPTAQYLLCVHNEGYAVSLEIRKVYRALPDAAAAGRHFVRVIDESGEDYLYPESWFVAIDLPHAAAALFAEAS
jgi:hypothetical protein